jgi:hypothetical protein
MDNYKKNLTAIDNLRKTNSKITKIEYTLKGKYMRNNKEAKFNNNILEDSMNKYHNIIKNLDNSLFR